MNKAIKIVLALTAMLVAGCNEGTVAPRTESPSESIVGGGSNAAVTGTDTLRFSFVIDPARTLTYPLGMGNWITFPARSLCDPVRSSYGQGQWDKPCAVATSPVVINTKAWLDADGFIRVDFDKDVRFVPTANPAGWVMLSFTSYGAATNPFTKITYCVNDKAKHCIDEAKLDPTLATIKNPATGMLTRRVKHFSGYSITAGDGCEDASDPACSSGGMNMVGADLGKLSKP